MGVFRMGSIHLFCGGEEDRIIRMKTKSGLVGDMDKSGCIIYFLPEPVWNGDVFYDHQEGLGGVGDVRQDQGPVRGVPHLEGGIVSWYNGSNEGEKPVREANGFTERLTKSLDPFRPGRLCTKRGGGRRGGRSGGRSRGRKLVKDLSTVKGCGKGFELDRLCLHLRFSDEKSFRSSKAQRLKETRRQGDKEKDRNR